jgi:hypothetical protein
MDGIWRNYDGNRKVISYRALSPDEIAEVLDTMPEWLRTQLGSRLEGVDGRTITDVNQLVNPGPELRPKFEDDGEEVSGDEEWMVDSIHRCQCRRNVSS